MTILARGSYVSKSCRAAVIDTFAMRPIWPLRTRLNPGKHTHGVLRFGVDSASERLAWCEVSLPRLLFGHNGRLLATQADMDAALEKLRGELAGFADVPAVAEWPKPSRLDLAWQFDVRKRLGRPPQALILAHGGLQHPAVREPPVPRRNSLTWEGSKLRLQLYGKSRKQKLGDSIIRAELRLRGEHMNRALRHGDWRKLSVLWPCYRAALCQLPSIPSPSKASGWPEAVGRVVPPEYRGRILAELTHKSPRSRRDYARRMSVAEAQLGTAFSWKDWLPMEGPPVAVHVERGNQSIGSER